MVRIQGKSVFNMYAPVYGRLRSSDGTLQELMDKAVFFLKANTHCPREFTAKRYSPPSKNWQ